MKSNARFRLAIFVVTGCGGIRSPYVDDSGVYHAADGAVVFVPGSACEQWDASHVLDPPPGCWSDPANGDDASACVQWAAARTPPGSPLDDLWCDPIVNNGYAGAGICAASWNFVNPSPVFPMCDLGPLGDQYCTAWGSTFFVSGEKLAFACAADSADAGSCWPLNTTDCHDVDSGNDAVYVTLEDGGVACELPCQR